MSNNDLPRVDDILPKLFELLADGKIHTYDEAIEKLADLFNLTEEQRTRTNPTNNNNSFGNLINMARAEMSRSKTGEMISTGEFRLTPCGGFVLRRYLAEISTTFLKNFECPSRF
mgnify:CR=1 FL=1